MTNTYVYRLDVEIPKDRQWPWEPPGFHDDHGCGIGDPNHECRFSWPVRRLFLARSSAMRRAEQMRGWGATVTVHRSEPVRWSE